jgi:hypothetical protein
MEEINKLARINEPQDKSNLYLMEVLALLSFILLDSFFGGISLVAGVVELLFRLNMSWSLNSVASKAFWYLYCFFF